MKTRTRRMARGTVVVGTLLSCVFAIGCTKRSIAGRLVADDGRIGVPCDLEMRDPRYTDRRIIGLLRVKTGEDFADEIERVPPHTPFHPISDTHEITVRCPGYAPIVRTFTVQQLWEGASLGTVQLQAVNQ